MCLYVCSMCDGCVLTVVCWHDVIVVGVMCGVLVCDMCVMCMWCVYGMCGVY